MGNPSAPSKILDKSILIRYSALFDDRSDDPKDIERVAELLCSLLSLQLFLLPYVDYYLIIYTLEPYIQRLQELLNLLKIKLFSFIIIDDQKDIAFSESIKNCSWVDRICIRRMLTDFRELPSHTFRLLMGTDCYFFNVPQEIIAYTWNQNPDYKVYYMIDNLTFGGKPYKLRYYQPHILPGLHGDFYCLAPGVTLKTESIMSCLKIVDDWPLHQRYLPDVPKQLREKVFTCEQPAASMLLGQFPAKMLPPSTYNHYAPKPKTILLHAKAPWRMIGKVPDNLFCAMQDIYTCLGYHHILNEMETAKIHERKFKRKIKYLVWKLTGYHKLI